MGRLALLYTLVTFQLLGCAKDKSSTETDGSDGTVIDDDDGDDGGDDGCSSDENCADWEICEETVCEDGDRNNSVEEAETVLWDESVEGRINPNGDVDYYAFEADGGEFIRVSTALEQIAADEGANTVVVIRKPNGKVVTSADGYANGVGVSDSDAVAYAYLDEAGTYYISVEDDGTYGTDPDGIELGFADYVYTLTLSEWGAHTSETDSVEDPGGETGLDRTLLLDSYGTLLQEEGDVDYIGLEIGPDVEGAWLRLDGNRDLEGSDATPRIRLLDASGDVYADKINVGPQGYALVPMVVAGDYVIEISDAEGGGGPNHWTYVHLLAADDDWDGSINPREEEDNDTQLLAQLLEQNESSTSSGDYTYANVVGWIGEGDEDWFAIEAGFGENWFGLCLQSLTYGSTLLPELELYDAEGELILSQLGTDDDPTLSIANETLSDGDYYLRVSDPAGEAGMPSDWYILTAYVASWEASGYGCPR